jgi:uncharacterized Zn finger protein
MVMAKLHIICGNCGADKNDLTYTIDPFGEEIIGEKIIRYKPSVHITCENCGTLHFLDTTLEKKE